MIADQDAVPPPIHAGTRRWSLAAAIASVAVFGLSIGQAAPLLSLLLETRGTDVTLNGVNAAATFLGVILGARIAPHGVRRFGVRNFLLLCFALDIVTTLSLKAFGFIAAWFALRFVLGVIGASIFTTSEAWINLLAAGERRGQIVGLYAGALAAGFGTGPLLLSLTGIQGWLPFALNATITAAATLPLLAIRGPASGFTAQQPATWRSIFTRAPLIFIAVALFGLYEAALMALLPVWGVRIGLSDRAAAATLSGIFLGAIALQVPIGWLSDKLTRRTVLRLCSAVGLVGAALLAVLSPSHFALFGLLFVWGGIASGIYPIALSMAGDRFHNAELVAVNSALISAYGLGALAGPVLAGAAMDLVGPRGLPAVFFTVFLAFLITERASPATGNGA
ncbi:MAG TPA: MFS transporter [Acetobacteraceae bacterium]|jgi:MFS family permease